MCYGNPANIFADTLQLNCDRQYTYGRYATYNYPNKRQCRQHDLSE